MGPVQKQRRQAVSDDQGQCFDTGISRHQRGLVTDGTICLQDQPRGPAQRVAYQQHRYALVEATAASRHKMLAMLPRQMHRRVGDVLKEPGTLPDYLVPASKVRKIRCFQIEQEPSMHANTDRNVAHRKTLARDE